MSNILVADCGSTKCAWTLIEAGSCERLFESPGMNPAVNDPEVVAGWVAESLAGIEREAVCEAHFYGAGCAGEGALSMRAALAAYLPDARVEVDSDLLGAARALFGHSAGVACILGTGSNSGYYDGCGIVKNVRPMGFIIGDEGSGAALGRMLLNQYYKGWLDEATRRDFEREFDTLTYDEVIRRIYREPGANRFLASFAPFVRSHTADPRLSERVREQFAAFISESLAAYPADLPVGFVGSLAAAFAPELSEMLGNRSATFLPSPIASLAAFHRH